MALERDFQTVLAQIFASRKLTQAEAARQTGVSQAWINGMLRSGQLPSWEKTKQLADGLRLTPQERAELFNAAGYVDRDYQDKAEIPQWPRRVVPVAEDLCRLKQDDLDLVATIVRKLAAQGVIFGDAIGA